MWKTDGTANGTVQVKDIRPGSDDSFPDNLTNVNGTLFFTANNGINGIELWKSDGTEAGTLMVKDVLAGSDSGAVQNGKNELVNVNGNLFFYANDGTTGRELWKSDGTEQGTILVKDIASGFGYNSSNPRQLTERNGKLYFFCYGSSSSVNGLWVSDGTQSGTTRLSTVYSGWLSETEELTNANGTLYFMGNNGSGEELWSSDGTTGGTSMVKDIRLGSFGSFPNELTYVDGVLFFQANDGSGGNELWKSDGTDAGTRLVTEIYPGNNGSEPKNLEAVNGILFFNANDGVHGRELWRSDGTSNGTFIVNDI